MSGGYPPSTYPPSQQGYAQPLQGGVPPGVQPPPQQYQQNMPPQAPPPQHAAYPMKPPQQSLAGTAAHTGDTLDPSGKYKIKFQGAFSAVEVAITGQDGCKSEAGSLVTCSHNVDLTAKLEGGVGAALCRACCTGESLFLTSYHLKPGMGDRGDILLAPAVPGEIILLHLPGNIEWHVQKGGFLAADASIDIGTHMQGLAQGCCSGAGFFILRATGIGRLLLNTYGSIVRYDLQPGETRRIDNGYLVAWTGNMQYTIGKAAKSLAATVFSGEGVMTVFTGPGTVYAQTRALSALADSLKPFLPSPTSGGADLGI